MKYIFITGGVVSSLGKGITAASLGRLLKARDYRISMQKLDPYYNIDPGLLSPLQHGEAFITDDGIAADLDLGHYERFTDATLRGESSVTTGKIHKAIMEQELRGDFKGGTVQVVPHVTNEIKRRIIETAEHADADVAIIEIGGTVGDMEGSPYLEAIRQLRWDAGEANCCFIHLTLVPFIGPAKEIKTKPTQHSVKALRSIGIQPDIVVCRTELPIPMEAREKIALFCDVRAENVVPNSDVDMLYEVPLMLEEEGLADKVCQVLSLPIREPDLTVWRALVEQAKQPKQTLRFGLVGKYVALPDAYLSVVEAVRHAAIAHSVAIDIQWIDSATIEEQGADACLAGLDGILAPGGHGRHGAEGIIAAADWAYTHQTPFLAIGYGMQLTVVAAVRSLLERPDAQSTEVNPDTPDPVVRIPKDRIGINDSRGNSRMGSQSCLLTHDSLLSECYGGISEIRERHGNRYEINPAYVQPLIDMGVRFPAMEKSEAYIEAIERPKHPFYIGVIYHPEYLSRPDRPHPLFNALVQRAMHNG